MTPGGFKPFEHLYSLPQAFDFHDHIGRAQVAERTHALNRQMKEGLAGIERVRLVTPIDERLSAGMTCFNVDGMSDSAVVDRLFQRRIVASVAPYATTHVRLAPSIRNTPDEIEAVLKEVHAL